MKKFIKVPFGKFYYQRFSKPIREKKDILCLMLDTLGFLSYGSSCEQEEGNLFIKVDKMSRVFYQLDDKYFSITFPFVIEENQKQKGSYCIYDVMEDLQIDNKLISMMKGIIEKVDFTNCTIENLFESIWTDSYDEDISEKEIESCFNIIMRVLSSEFGYVRFDYDPIHENGNMHPLNHLDINYSGRCTYKLGLKNRIDIDEFIDILDIGTKCSYVAGS